MLTGVPLAYIDQTKKVSNFFCSLVAIVSVYFTIDDLLLQGDNFLYFFGQVSFSEISDNQSVTNSSILILHTLCSLDEL